MELPLEIEAEELASWRGDGRPLTVLDVRERWETQICMIAGSVTIPLGNLPQSLDRLSGEAPVVVVCHHGTRSLQATAWLRRNGFANVTNLRGGIDAWARRIEPNMSSY
ncbi:MAG: sulfurtransferase [Proteobacteria bacterium]|nr:sulfurtransferase [Pseudomonadota bacterium]